MRNSLDVQLFNEIRTRLNSFSTSSAIPTIFGITRELIDERPDLIERWTLEKIAYLVQREKGRMTAAQNPPPFQDFLPGLDLAAQVPQPKKAIVVLGECTIHQLKAAVTVIRRENKERAEKRMDRRIGPLKRLIVEMSPYARMRHGLTVGEYCEVRAGIATLDRMVAATP